jgi:predicted sugar kinase
MEASTTSLVERVERLLGHKDHQPLLSTTATSAAIAELASRSTNLELAVLEIAAEVEKLGRSERPRTA